MHTQWGKKQSFTVYRKYFVKPIYTIIQLVKTLISTVSRNVFQKPMTRKIVYLVSTSQCGNCCCELVSHIFGKNFVKVTFIIKKSWFHEIFVFPCALRTHDLLQKNREKTFPPMNHKLISRNVFYGKTFPLLFRNSSLVKHLDLMLFTNYDGR